MVCNLVTIYPETYLNIPNQRPFHHTRVEVSHRFWIHNIGLHTSSGTGCHFRYWQQCNEESYHRHQYNEQNFHKLRYLLSCNRPHLVNDNMKSIFQLVHSDTGRQRVRFLTELTWTSDVNVYYPFDIVWVITGISAVALVVIPNNILIPIHDIDFNTGMQISIPLIISYVTFTCNLTAMNACISQDGSKNICKVYL